MTTTRWQARTLSDVVAENIRAEAARRRFTQVAIARELGLHPTSVGDRFSGETPWTLNEVQRVAALLGVRTTTLLECAIRDSNPEPSDMDSQGSFALVLGVAA